MSSGGFDSLVPVFFRLVKTKTASSEFSAFSEKFSRNQLPGDAIHEKTVHDAKNFEFSPPGAFIS